MLTKIVLMKEMVLAGVEKETRLFCLVSDLGGHLREVGPVHSPGQAEK